MNEIIANSNLLQIQTVLENMNLAVISIIILLTLIPVLLSFLSIIQNISWVFLIICLSVPLIYTHTTIKQFFHKELLTQVSLSSNIYAQLSTSELSKKNIIYHINETRTVCTRIIEVKEEIPTNNKDLSKIETKKIKAPCELETTLLTKVKCNTDTHNQCLKLIKENYQQIITGTLSQSNIALQPIENK